MKDYSSEFYVFQFTMGGKCYGLFDRVEDGENVWILQVMDPSKKFYDCVLANHNTTFLTYRDFRSVEC